MSEMERFWADGGLDRAAGSGVPGRSVVLSDPLPRRPPAPAEPFPRCSRPGETMDGGMGECSRGGLMPRAGDGVSDADQRCTAAACGGEGAEAGGDAEEDCARRDKEGKVSRVGC